MYKPYDKDMAEGRQLIFHVPNRDLYVPARIICKDRKTNDDNKLMVLVETSSGFESFTPLKEDGTDVFNNQRLFMLPIKMELWGYIWQHKGGIGYMLSTPFDSESDAVEHADTFSSTIDFIKAVLIREWEE